MTPEEIVLKYRNTIRSIRRKEVAQDIQSAIADAVAAEREACAKIAEKRSTGLTTDEIRASTQTASSIAAAIRARNEANHVQS